MKHVYIGTSGWSYEHWVVPFYGETPSTRWLPFYATYFSTVEINSTFYHLPTEKSVKHWAASTPKDFIFSVKMSRYVTHIKRLREGGEGVGRFLTLISPLKGKLGPILFLIPSFIKRDDGRLAQFLEELPKGYRYTFEFRNSSWLAPEIYHLLESRGAALCISHFNGKLTPCEITAPFVYIRLHGPKGAYEGSYDLRTLKQWAKRIEGWNAQKRDVYIYFDNDELGFAVHNALKLKQLLSV